MNYTDDLRLEKFIHELCWSDIPEDVQQRVQGCFLDLLGAIIIGSRSKQFRVGLRMAERFGAGGTVPVIGTEKRFDTFWAAAAMGHASNAYDIDDGHNLIRAHPGTSFVGGVLAAACEKNTLRNEFLNALLAAYETTIRMGAAIMDYYQYAHSSGTFGAVGTAAGVGKIFNFSEAELNNVLSIAEFNAPLVPGIRSVEYPSMNKDGVPFGVMVGMLAVEEQLCGFEGNRHMLQAEPYRHYMDDLGKHYNVMDLYFKPYACCRWAHPAIDACLILMKEHNLKPENMRHITIRTFKRATRLSKIIPKTIDEAQYNIAYPVAAALTFGEFGYNQMTPEALSNPKIAEMMSRLSFEVDPDLEVQFPQRRICRAEITDQDGSVYLSPDCEPRGEASENIQPEWLAAKFRKTTAPVFSKRGQDRLIQQVLGSEDIPIRSIIDLVNKSEFWIQ